MQPCCLEVIEVTTEDRCLDTNPDQFGTSAIRAERGIGAGLSPPDRAELPTGWRCLPISGRRRGSGRDQKSPVARTSAFRSAHAPSSRGERRFPHHRVAPRPFEQETPSSRRPGTGKHQQGCLAQSAAPRPGQRESLRRPKCWRHAPHFLRNRRG